MKIGLVALACALSTAACGSQDNRPAQNPASTSSTSERTDTTVVTPSSASEMSNDHTADITAGTTQITSGTSMTSANTAASNRAPDTSANAGQVGQTPAVVNNPGVADQTKNADNTKINDRDRHGALTPMDQGNSGSETKITAAIRKGLMVDSTLSFTAKNVKVITVGSKVTLRGPVKNDQEKAAIAALAKQTAGVSEVDNQLEVKK